MEGMSWQTKGDTCVPRNGFEFVVRNSIPMLVFFFLQYCQSLLRRNQSPEIDASYRVSLSWLSSIRDTFSFLDKTTCHFISKWSTQMRKRTPKALRHHSKCRHLVLSNRTAVDSAMSMQNPRMVLSCRLIRDNNLFPWKTWHSRLWKLNFGSFTLSFGFQWLLFRFCAKNVLLDFPEICEHSHRRCELHSICFKLTHLSYYLQQPFWHSPCKCWKGNHNDLVWLLSRTCQRTRSWNILHTPSWGHYNPCQCCSWSVSWKQNHQPQMSQQYHMFKSSTLEYRCRHMLLSLLLKCMFFFNCRCHDCLCGLLLVSGFGFELFVDFRSVWINN